MNCNRLFILTMSLVSTLFLSTACSDKENPGSSSKPDSNQQAARGVITDSPTASDVQKAVKVLFDKWVAVGRDGEFTPNRCAPMLDTVRLVKVRDIRKGLRGQLLAFVNYSATVKTTHACAWGHFSTVNHEERLLFDPATHPVDRERYGVEDVPLGHVFLSDGQAFFENDGTGWQFSSANSHIQVYTDK